MAVTDVRQSGSLISTGVTVNTTIQPAAGTIWAFKRGHIALYYQPQSGSGGAYSSIQALGYLTGNFPAFLSTLYDTNYFHTFYGYQVGAATSTTPVGFTTISNGSAFQYFSFNIDDEYSQVLLISNASSNAPSMFPYTITHYVVNHSSIFGMVNNDYGLRFIIANYSGSGNLGVTLATLRWHLIGAAVS